MYTFPFRISSENQSSFYASSIPLLLRYLDRFPQSIHRLHILIDRRPQIQRRVQHLELQQALIARRKAPKIHPLPFIHSPQTPRSPRSRCSHRNSSPYSRNPPHSPSPPSPASSPYTRSFAGTTADTYPYRPANRSAARSSETSSGRRGTQGFAAGRSPRSASRCAKERSHRTSPSSQTRATRGTPTPHASRSAFASLRVREKGETGKLPLTLRPR